jgi:hypothetical protein
MEYFTNFVNSNAFVGLVTLAVGSVAFIIYGFGKRDKKRDAAKVLLLEVRSAQRRLKKIKKDLQENNKLSSDSMVMPSNSWVTNRHMFINDFDAEEWDEISEFYDNCNIIDKLIEYQNSFFWNDVEAIRENKHRMFADFAKKIFDETVEKAKAGNKVSAEDAIKEAQDMVDAYNNMYEKTFRLYAPEAVLTDANKYVDRISLNISQTAIGAKLKKLSGDK